MPDNAMEAQQDSKKEEKARKKEEKLKKKQEKKAARQESEMAEEQETAGGKLVVFFATIVIIAIWLGILALLVRLDVGGFGSTVLYPILKDVPYVNKILPEAKKKEEENEDYPYKTLDEAIARIQELEGELDGSLQSDKDKDARIEELQAQVRKYRKYRDNEAAFETLKQEFYEEVVFGDDAPDISEYQKFYEAIDPDNAEVLYKEVVEQGQYNDKVNDYVKTYSSMKAKEAAAIFDTMTDDMSLVKRILEKMTSESRADILSAMSEDNAAKLTKMLEPDKN
ncbi:MAG: hypothetical protein HFH32_07520 [Eubacterium sp.]|jgi:flagellar motility protein MotE (MotC chaperone)|nr:hypothetical protein [Eubacterium sp.]